MALAAFLVVSLLILVNSLYVAAEFSAVSVRGSRIRELAQGGNRLARLLEPVVATPATLDRYVAACQIGITLSSLTLGAYGQASIAPALSPHVGNWLSLDPLFAESATVTGVLVVLTMLQVLIGELVPKSLALQSPTRMAMITVIPMRWSLAAFRALIHVLNGSGVAILRLLGLPDAGSHRHVHSPEELALLIEESHEGGLIESEEQHRLHQALRLPSRTARDLMVPRTAIDAVDIRWDSDRLLKAVLDSPYTRMPVYDGSLDRPIGLLHTRALAADLARHRDRPARVRHLTTPLPVVPETASGDDLLRFFREQKAHQAVVVDEYGSVAGLVTLQDVVSALLGDVGDEFRPGAMPRVSRMPDGRLRLSGQLPLGELPGWLVRRWSGPGSGDTVGTHVVAALDRIPTPGEQVTINDVAVEIGEITQRAPAWVVVTPMEDES
jgi:putative hemolysin